MSMFSGLTNQISGMMAQKLGGNKPEGEEEAANNQEQQPQDGNAEEQQLEEEEEEAQEEEGEAGEQQAAASGVSGFAQGLMARAMSAKEGLKEKASHFNAEQVKGVGMGFVHNMQSLIPGAKKDVPEPEAATGEEEEDATVEGEGEEGGGGEVAIAE